VDGVEKVVRGKKRDAIRVWPVVSPITLLERGDALFVGSFSYGKDRVRERLSVGIGCWIPRSLSFWSNGRTNCRYWVVVLLGTEILTVKVRPALLLLG